MKKENLKLEYQRVCNLYLEKFLSKHSFQSDYKGLDIWVGNEAGTVAMISDMFVSFNDIRYDIDNDVPEHMFLKWYNRHEEITCLDLPYPNYKQYCNGYPDKYTDEDIKEIEKLRGEVSKAKDKLQEALDDLKKN